MGLKPHDDWMTRYSLAGLICIPRSPNALILCELSTPLLTIIIAMQALVFQEHLAVRCVFYSCRSVDTWTYTWTRQRMQSTP